MRQQTFLRFVVVALATVAAAGCGRSELEVPEDVPTFDGDVPRPDVPRPDVPDVPVVCTNNAQCDDTLFCNGEETCVGGFCQPGTPVACNDGIDCTADRCDEMIRACTSAPDDSRCPATTPPSRCDIARGCVNVGCTSNTECDDGDVCNGVESCRAGACVREMPPRCDDGVACTRDTCVPRVGCQSVPDNDRCSDGVFCNGAEVCNPMVGGCVPTPPPRCEDGNPCTTDRCDEATRSCASTHTDDDGDTFAPARCGGPDCDDTDARVNPAAREVCTDGRDNNCDGLSDCRDPMCARDPACVPCMPTGPENNPGACSDGRDNDCNGLPDCRDPACLAIPDFCRPCVPTSPEETGPGACSDGRDNDCNGFTDCADIGCSATPACCVRTGPESGPIACTDGRDNDCNGVTDCRDPACAMVPACIMCIPTGRVEVCNDGRDNDCNGSIDCVDPACAPTPACVTVPNDTCASPTTIGVPGRASGSTASARNDFNPSCRMGGDAPDVVYVFRNPVRQTIIIDTVGSAYDTVLMVRRNCVAGPDIACDDDAGGGLASRVVLTDAEPGTYFVIVDGFGSNRGAYQLNITTGTPREACDNFVDDDGDGLIDCRDPDCVGSPFCGCMPTGPESTDMACADGVDNDCDGAIDCIDTQCRVFPRCMTCTPENTNAACLDGRDNDCDRLVDCADPDCAGLPVCPCRPTGPENNPFACGDGRDNDCDGLVDCRDAECAMVPACMICTPTGPENTATACSDGRDNDCDRLLDCADPDCGGIGPCACVALPENCSDSRDNDCDRLVDCADPDCAMNPVCVGAPPNDQCAGAIRVGVPSVTVGSTATAGPHFTPVTGPAFPGCAGGAGPDVVYTFTVATTTTLTVNLTATGAWDPVVFVRRDTCDAGPQVACNDDFTGTNSQTTFTATPGTYFVFVDGFGAASSGPFTLTISVGAPPENCTNFRDDDGDGLTDCMDPDCAMTPACLPCTPTGPENTVAACTDGRDNDCDRQVDCDDVQCAAIPACCRPTGPENTMFTCSDRRDNDCNGLIDCADPGCRTMPFCCVTTGPENTSAVCVDGRDNDCDGLLDCADPDCAATTACCRPTGLENTALTCSDGRDNDCDGLTDCADTQCALTPACCRPTPENTDLACRDGRDNDCDGLVDCRDPNCATTPACRPVCTPTAPREGTVALCTDGLDNDCDGQADCADSDCSPFPAMGSECCNGRDDNGNTIVDEFACGCTTNAQCAGIGAGGRFPSNTCYNATVSVCGPACNTIGGNAFCSALFMGTTCDTTSGQCR